MKRLGYLYEKVCSIENLQLALTMAVRGKRKTKWILYVLEHRDYFCQLLQNQLLNGEFKPSENVIKTIVEQASGKVRRLEIPKFFPDRIVHWAICIVLQPLFKRGMYRYCIGSVPKRGGNDGRKFIVKVLKKDKQIKYVMKLDLRKFFQSVSHDKMKQLFRTKIKDKKLLHLLDMIIDAGTEGLPIGYYSSQWFSNFYLEKVDHLIKEKLRVRYYVRNVDDMLFLDSNKRKLHKVLHTLIDFLQSEGFKVTVKGDWQVWKLHSRPINFLGFLYYENKTYIRRRNFYRFTRKIRRVERKGYCNVRNARAITSGLGAIKHIPHGKQYYTSYIKPIISKHELHNIISLADRRIKGVA